MSAWLNGGSGAGGGADEELELLDENDVDAWLGSTDSSAKPQTHATIKPQHVMNSDDWASDSEDEDDEDDDDDDDYGSVL